MSRLRFRALTIAAAIAAAVLVGAQGTALSAPAHAVESATANAPRPVPSDGPWTHGTAASGDASTAPGDASARSLVGPQKQGSATATVSRAISGVVNLPSQAPTAWYQGVWVYAMDAAGYQAGAGPANSAGGYSITGLAPASTPCG